MNKKRVFSFLLAAVLMLSATPILSASAEPNEATAVSDPTADDSSSSSGSLGYFDYLAAHKDAKTGNADVEVNVLDFTGSDGVVNETYKDDSGESHESVKLVTGGYVEWKVNVPETGLYNLRTLYLPVADKPINAELRLYIDGETPFKEATSITFSRIWKDEYPDSAKFNDYGHRIDSNGNELAPSAVEIQRWTDVVIHDNDYMTDADLLFYFEAGEHTIRFASQRESVAFASLKLTSVDENISYDEYLSKHSGAEKYTGAAIRYEAENASERSDRALSMANDGYSASTTPTHYSQTRLNTIGGESWKKVGQWISWDVEVEQDGLYSLSFKYIQNYVRGFNTYRTVKVDGKVPYKEFECISFTPNNEWTNFTLSDSDGNPYYIYLTKGEKHTITLQASLGEIVDSLQSIQSCITELNNDYLEIISITGSSPDSLRDYDLDKEIPWLIDSFKSVRKTLNTVYGDLSKANGNISGGMSSFLEVMIKQLDNFIKNPLNITTALGSYKSNISSLSDMLSDMTNQSLLLDSIFVGGENDLPRTSVGFWSSLTYGVRAFFASFASDYNAYGSDYSSNDSDIEYVCDPITVWVGGGRDQYNVIKTLIEDKFVPEYKIPVRISLVAADLTQAILAGVGPDASIMVGNGSGTSQVTNYAMRGALENMDQFDAKHQYDKDGNLNYRYTFDEVKTWFHKSAFIVSEYLDGKTYGLPETQDFPMMFYRVDVLERLGIDLPETWDDLRDALTIIQRENMNVGINAVGLNTYVYQNGGTYFNEERTATNLTNQTTVDAFKTYTSFYTDYAVPVSYDALNRFRSGEYPIVINAYNFYNNLSVGAPEIKGLWKMTRIPGTVREDGTVDHTSMSTSSVSIIIKGCENKNRVYDFISWWVSADAQATYGNNIEARLGTGGRYTTANREAFDMLPWDYESAQEIKRAWEDVTDTPKLPGDYYVERMLSNAYRAVVYSKSNPREMLVKYTKEIDKELARKRAQYKVDSAYDKK